MLKKALASLALAGFVMGCGGTETKKPSTPPAKPSTSTTKPAETKPAEKKADAPAPPKAEEKKAEAPKTEEKKK